MAEGSPRQEYAEGDGMKQRPILFSKPMVFAIMDGFKTQTRRVVKGLPNEVSHIKPDAYGEGIYHLMSENSHVNDPIACPYGRPGDQLWVKETVWVDADTKEFKWYAHQRIFNVDRVRDNARLWPSIHMKRAWSRIQLEITGIRVERLQDISEADARSEGITDGGCLNCGKSEPCGCDVPAPDARDAFIYLWRSINGPDSWDANPWVWVVEFKKVIKA